jgi:P4 family phage/plasmid primase-like protien
MEEGFRTCEECEYYFNPFECSLIKGLTNKKQVLEAYKKFSGVCTDYKQKREAKNKKEPNMTEALEHLNINYIFKVPTDTEEILGYEEGIYKPFKWEIKDLLEKQYGDKLKRSFVDETLAHIQRANYIERKEINKFINKLPIQNGIFHFVTHDIKPFKPEEVFTYKLNVSYNPEAKCPNFLKFINEILRPEDIPLLQEIMGYCLLPGMPFHKIFWFYGIGRNGKDRIVLTLEHILGEDSCSHLNLGELRESRRFSVAQLYGKLLNVSSEPDSKYPIQTNILKLISGENTIHAELKMKNTRLRFKNVAKPIVVGNKFPKVEDSSIAFWDRVEVLNFPFSFTGEKAIQNIERQWLEKPDETSGIFNWLLVGLYRLQENRVFSTSKTTEETKAEFMRVSDPFTAWLHDRCVFIQVGKVTRQEAYDNYKDYADEIGAAPESTRVFYAKIRRTPKIRDIQTRDKDGKMERYFQGLAFRTVEDDENQQVLDASVPLAPVVPSTGNYSQDLVQNPIGEQYKIAGTSGTSGTKIHCFDCGAPLGHHEVYSFGGNRFCRKCRLKLEKGRKNSLQNSSEKEKAQGEGKADEV